MLGFLGTTLYAIGIVLAVVAFFPARRKGHSNGHGAQELAYRAIFLSTLAQLVAGNIFPGVGGLMMWSCLGLWMGSLAHAEVAAETEEQTNWSTAFPAPRLQPSL